MSLAQVKSRMSKKRANKKQTDHHDAEFTPEADVHTSLTPEQLNQLVSNHIDDHAAFLDVPLSEIPLDRLPRTWDWTDVGGVNYLPNPRDQGDCGSCYAIAFTSMLESRLRIQSKNDERPDLSVQNLLSCNFYCEGCNGGDSSLVAKFVSEFDIYPEECYEYTATDGACENLCDTS